MWLHEVQHEIDDGDLLLFCGRSLFGRLIRCWSQSPYSHVAVVVWLWIGGERRPCVFEAVEGPGVRLCPLANYLIERQGRNEAVDWYQIVDPAIERHLVIVHLLSTWGQAYASVWQFVVSFTWLGRLWRKLTARPLALNDRRPFCSWHAAAALMLAGFVPDAGLPANPAETTPGDVARFTCLRRRGPLMANIGDS